MSKKMDLSLVFYYGDHPIRVGKCGDDVIFSLYDLMNVFDSTSNVTILTRRLPEETFFRGTSVDLEGSPCNTTSIAVTYEGACLALPRMKRVDLYDVLVLMRWMKTVKADKIKGA